MSDGEDTRRQSTSRKWTTDSGIEVEPCYGPQDASKSAGRLFPFTRGIYADMYRGRVWTMRQYAGFGTAEETNERFRYLLDRGQTGLSVAFDLPTQMGHDSDAAMAQGEVGRVGVADRFARGHAATLRRHPSRRCLHVDDDQLDGVDSPGPVRRARRRARRTPGLARRHGAERRAQGVHRARHVHLSGGPEPEARLGHHRILRSRDSAVEPDLDLRIPHPGGRVDGSSGGRVHICRRARVRGTGNRRRPRHRVVRARLSFFFAAHNDLLEEVAKFRAARRLWAKLLKERYGGSDESCRLRFHTQTGGSTLTAQQALNNVVRVTVQALAATLGGTQSLHTNAFDEALALPTEESAKLALRTQQIVAAECGVTRTVDPLGGSHYIEALTDEIERRAVEYLDAIDELGGAAQAIDYMQEEIQRAAYAFQMHIESGERSVVGVNLHTEDEGPGHAGQPDHSVLERGQIERLTALKGERDAAEVRARLVAIRDGARGTGNLLPSIIDAVKAGVTLGEISDGLRAEWGVFDG